MQDIWRHNLPSSVQELLTSFLRFCRRRNCGGSSWSTLNAESAPDMCWAVQNHPVHLLGPSKTCLGQEQKGIHSSSTPTWEFELPEMSFNVFHTTRLISSQHEATDEVTGTR